MHSKCLDKHKMQRDRNVHVVHFGEISEISSERRETMGRGRMSLW